MTKTQINKKWLVQYVMSEKHVSNFDYWSFWFIHDIKAKMWKKYGVVGFLWIEIKQLLACIGLVPKI